MPKAGGRRGLSPGGARMKFSPGLPRTASSPPPMTPPPAPPSQAIFFCSGVLGCSDGRDGSDAGASNEAEGDRRF